MELGVDEGAADADYLPDEPLPDSDPLPDENEAARYRDYVRGHGHGYTRQPARVLWPVSRNVDLTDVWPLYDPEANYEGLPHTGLDVDDFHPLQYQRVAGVTSRLKRQCKSRPEARRYLIPRGFMACMDTLAAQQRLAIAKLFCTDGTFNSTSDTSKLFDIGRRIVVFFCVSATQHEFTLIPPGRRKHLVLGTFATVWRLCEHFQCSGACRDTRSRNVLNSLPIPSIHTLRALYVAYG
jgi:hypothetical protein